MRVCGKYFNFGMSQWLMHRSRSVTSLRYGGKGNCGIGEAVQKLEPLHIWKESVIRERFDYDDEPGRPGRLGSVQLAVLRVWELAETWWIPQHRRYGGCRSWVDLPEIPHQIAAAELRLIDAPGIAEHVATVLENVSVDVSVTM